MTFSPFRGSSWRNVVLGAVVISACAVPAALADTGTGTCPPGSSTGPYCQRIPTKLVAQPVIPGGIFATLTRTDTGAPLPGQTLTFTAGSTVLCTATTNATGTAGCTSLLAVLLALLNLGYTVNYAGNSTYLPSTAQGPVLSLLGIVIGPGLTINATSTHGRLDSIQRARIQAKLHAIGRARLTADLQKLRAHHSLH